MKRLVEIIGGNNKQLKEYNEDDSFLSDYDSAEEYAINNIDDVANAFEAYEEDPNNIHVEYQRDHYVELIDLYVDKYRELMDEESVTIYRLIKLNSLSDLDVDDVGIHWSFEEDGVGDYGGMHPNRGMTKTGKPFILEGKVSPKDIDWVYGFNSFMWYGEDQWECALTEGSKVVIISINGEVLEYPINATVGPH